MKLIRKLSHKKYDDAFYDYQLSTSLNLIRSVAVIVGLFNLVLIIPDFINLTAPVPRILMLVFRIVFTLVAGAMFLFAKKIKSFRKLALVLTICELTAVFIYFCVLSMYPQPDFTIQLLGVFIIIIAIFLIPNIWGFMLMLSIAIAAGFLVYSYYRLGIDGAMGLGSSLFSAAVVYLAIEIALCGIFAYSFNKYKRGEFVARTELQSIYDTDPLTKVGNRAKLENAAVKWMSYCARHSLRLSLMLIDVDNLKLVNDEYGHISGDSVLCEIAGIMHTQLRESDVCVRWGGDEFVLLLPHTSIEEAKTLAERIRASIQEHKFSNDAVVTCSFGIAEMKEGLSLTGLIHQADHSMYLAKKLGKDNIIAAGSENITKQ